MNIKHFAYRLTCATGLLVATASAWAQTTTFREIPALPVIPPSIEHPAERDVLVRDIAGLAARQKSLIALREAFSAQCSQPRVGGTVTRKCQFRRVEIRRESSRLRTDTLALKERMRRIETGVLQQRSAGGLPRRHRAPGRKDRRFDLVRDALENGGGTWKEVLDPMHRRSAKATGDPALRDATAYLEGMYRGWFAAARLDDPYYKHGVRRALAGDDWSAATAFGRAARDNPGDPLVYAAFASAAGRQHASPACRKARRCVGGDAVAWAARFGEKHALVMRRLVRAGADNAASPVYRRDIDLLRAFTIYEASRTGETRQVALPAITKRGEKEAAVRGYIEQWRKRAPDRSAIFLAHYRQALTGQTYGDGDAGTASSKYLSDLRQELASNAAANPFAGALTRAQIIKLQRVR